MRQLVIGGDMWACGLAIGLNNNKASLGVGLDVGSGNAA